MSLLDAPSYDPSHDNLVRNSIIGVVVLLIVAFLLGVGGRIAGHGWFFMNLGAEHRVSHFLTDLEQKDYAGAYSIYTGGHPDSGYPLSRFTEDWTTYSPVKGPITSHHVDVSGTDGTGLFGTGTIVAVRLNGNTKAFIYVNRADDTLTWPAPHEIEY
jgi:hypothetical protein